VSGSNISTLQVMPDMYIAMYARQKRKLMLYKPSSKGGATVPTMQITWNLLVVGSPVVLEICIFHSSISHDACAFVQLFVTDVPPLFDGTRAL